MTDNSSYIAILTDSLVKKLDILEQIKVLCDKQKQLLAAEVLDDAAFDEIMDQKEKLIINLGFLDNGFENTYIRVKDELNHNKSAHSADIQKMQGLIAQITDMSTAIQALEMRNEASFKNHFKEERQKVRQSRATVSAVSGYYKTMTSSAAARPQFMDQKQ